MNALSLPPTSADTVVVRRRGGPAFITGVAIVAACSASNLRPASPNARVASADHLRVKTTEHGAEVVREVTLEDYVEATVLSEFAPAAGSTELVEQMFEVQAVISRTFALSHRGRHAAEGYDLCSTTHCQLYDPPRLQTSRWAPSAEQAIRRTAGLVLWYENAPAEALFHADCGGHTSTASEVWGGPGHPYLRALEDDGPAAGAHITWQFSTSASALIRALNADPRTRVGRRLQSIAVIARDQAGRSQHVALKGELESIVRGEDLRDVMTRTFGPRTLRSTWFEVVKNGDQFVFTGRGYGHGVGLCQAGALARLEKGAKPTAVLQRYFPGATLVRID